MKRALEQFVKERREDAPPLQQAPIGQWDTARLIQHAGQTQQRYRERFGVDLAELYDDLRENGVLGEDDRQKFQEADTNELVVERVIDRLEVAHRRLRERSERWGK